MGVGNFILSATFTVSGHSWAIRFYPNGLTVDTIFFAYVALVLMDKGAKVRAFYDMLLVNQIKCCSKSKMPFPITILMYEEIFIQVHNLD